MDKKRKKPQYHEQDEIIIPDIRKIDIEQVMEIMILLEDCGELDNITIATQN